jgi:hypothetical protein
MQDDKEPFGMIYIDNSLESYKDYLDSKRIKKIATRVDEDTVLGKHLFRLFMDLRGIHYNASMPYILPHSIATFHSGYTQSLNPNRSLLNFASAIMKRLSNEVPQLIKNRRLARKIKQRLVEMSSDYLDIDQKFPVIDSKSLWDNYLDMENSTFAYAVWSNQRVSYLAGFSAYDNFMARVIKDALKLPECRTTSRYFSEDIKKAFGSEVTNVAWTGDEMITLRLIRNSLAHAGGKLTDELKQRKHGCIIENDIIQITPENIKHLFRAIISAVESIVDKSCDNEWLNKKCKTC